MLTKPKKTVRSAGGGLLSLGIAASAMCIQGGIAILASGFARPGRPGQGVDTAAKAADVLTYRAAGVFIESKAGGAANGDGRIDVQQGPWLMANVVGADAVTVADIGRRCFIVDDETVSRSSASATRVVAGVVESVDATGVMVDITLANSAALSA